MSECQQAVMVVGHTWGDTVAVKGLLLWKFLPLPLCFLSDFPSFLGGTETSASLLVHLRSGRDAINSHEEELLWFNLAEKMVYIRKNGGKYLLLRHAEMSVAIVRMRTYMPAVSYIKLAYPLCVQLCIMPLKSMYKLSKTDVRKTTRC